MSIIDLVNVRELAKEDLNFIISSFIQSLSKYTESIVKGQTKEAIVSYLEKMILLSLTEMGYSTFIACHKEDSDNIIGYIIADPETNHIFFNYTKYNYRKLGIQEHLLFPLVIDPAQAITCNWPTKEVLKKLPQNTITICNKFVEKLIEKVLK